MFGFPDITDIGAGLQDAAESADDGASRRWLGELSHCLDAIARAAPATTH
jgi:hypothetical protein